MDLFSSILGALSSELKGKFNKVSSFGDFLYMSDILYL